MSTAVERRASSAGAAVKSLLSLATSDEAFNTPQAELLPLQLAATNERLQERLGKIRLLANRAEGAGVKKITKPADLVPLLFSHTAYKSYAETWLTNGKWDRMSKWLETVSAYPTQGIELGGIKDLDDWIKRLETVGHYVTCSSGTTGKPAILTCSKEDLDFSGRIFVRAMAWALNVKPAADYKGIGLGGTAKAARTEAIRVAMIDAFVRSGNYYQVPGPVITVGQIAAMIRLRRKIANGTALPTEIAEFEKISSGRQTAFDEGKDAGIEEFINSRNQKLLIMGMWPNLYLLAEGVRAKGYSAKDFSRHTLGMVAGGMKGAKLPANYREIIFDTFNLEPKRLFHSYSMQEINSQFPLCPAGRYHIPAWTMLLMLNESGEQLLDPGGGGDIEGRAAFFDITVESRWGGIISGDKVKANFSKCACGRHGPTVDHDITRYADLISGDKIACSGTIDAYMRGAV
jgi:hypothetical protein